MILPIIDLSDIQPDMGPRHLLFVDDFMFVVTEFACQVLKIDLRDMKLVNRTTMTNPITQDTTGAEIRGKQEVIYVTLRISGRPGYLLRFDDNLHDTGRLQVGRNPRFFDIDGDLAVVLNQDDQSMTIIDLQQWKIISTVSDLKLNPQTFVTI